MTEQYNEAPPLPREPTAIGISPIPSSSSSQQQTTTSNISQQDSSITSDLPAPPKFPSLSDVALLNAQQAAQNIGLQQQPNLSSNPELSSTITTTTTTITTVESQSSIQEDIRAVIQRDSVTPGSSVQKALKAGADHWNSDDQKQLDKLLKEGKRVYVPPDVDAYDLPVTRDTQFVPVPPSASEASPTDSYNSRTFPERIAMWNQVIAKDGSMSSSIPTGTRQTNVAFISPTGTSNVSKNIKSIESRNINNNNNNLQGETINRSIGEEIEKSKKNSVTSPSTIINGLTNAGTFLTVNVISKSHSNRHPTTAAQSSLQPSNSDTKDENSNMTTENSIVDEPLLVDSSANISVTDDYGLKGGHDSRVHDAAFFDAQTLVTCGADGKVIIWDMLSRTVVKEFSPYEGEAVTMIYPMTDEEEEIKNGYTLMTLSESRLLRVWAIEDTHAVVLHSAQITASEKELFMSVPVISEEIRLQASAAIAAAKSNNPIESDTTITQVDDVNLKSITKETINDPSETPTTTTTEPITAATTETAQAASPKETEKERKGFFTKVLSFGRNTNKKAVAS